MSFRRRSRFEDLTLEEMKRRLDRNFTIVMVIGAFTLAFALTFLAIQVMSK